MFCVVYPRVQSRDPFLSAAIRFCHLQTWNQSLSDDIKIYSLAPTDDLSLVDILVEHLG